MLTIAGGIALFFVGLIALYWFVVLCASIFERLTHGKPHTGPLIRVEPYIPEDKT